jgi:hypothetical protein
VSKAFELPKTFEVQGNSTELTFATDDRTNISATTFNTRLFHAVKGNRIPFFFDDFDVAEYFEVKGMECTQANMRVLASYWACDCESCTLIRTASCVVNIGGCGGGDSGEVKLGYLESELDVDASRVNGAGRCFVGHPSNSHSSVSRYIHRRDYAPYGGCSYLIALLDERDEGQRYARTNLVNNIVKMPHILIVFRSQCNMALLSLVRLQYDG